MPNNSMRPVSMREYFKKYSQQELLILFVGLVISIVGLMNVLPNWGIQIGPFPMEIYRPFLFVVAILIGLCIYPFTTMLSHNRASKMLGISIDITLIIATLWVSWLYYGVTLEMYDDIVFFENTHGVASLISCILIIIISFKMWGAPLALVALVSLIYFYTGEHWPWIFKTTPISFAEDSSASLLFNTSSGIFGNIMGIVANIVLPFIVLGALLEGTGGGRSLVKISFNLFKRFRGGPAHAAIMASGMFGSISGSAVANVVGTGVITIPLIKQRGFAPHFAGGVEATASTGGSIMPPIMGAAAIVMSDLIGISYLTIIQAALIPALAYYGSLFVSVIFESRRLNIEVKEEQEAISDDLKVTRQDYINLSLVVIPLVMVTLALISGLSPSGSAIVAIFSLFLIGFINPELRKAPYKLIESLALGGKSFIRILVAAMTVSIVMAVFEATGLATDFALIIADDSSQSLLFSLIIAAISALILGMGMPTLPAYLTIIIILGPTMMKLGLEPLVAHMFVFYFGVASSITPPVAMASYAAANVAGSTAMRTAFSAVKVGGIIFLIPFAFAFNPMLLIVSESGVAFEWAPFIWAIIRMSFAVYLIASTLSAFDVKRLNVVEIVLRFIVGVLILSPETVVNVACLFIAILLLVYHHIFLTSVRRRWGFYGRNNHEDKGDNHA